MAAARFAKKIEPEIQIGAQHAFLDERVQVAMRRGDHANVDRRRAPRAEFHHFALLQHAQQLALQGPRNFADFIEKDRPRMRDFEEPRAAAAPRAGERTLLVSEQFTFDHPFWQRRAIESDEWVAAPAARIVNACAMLTSAMPGRRWSVFETSVDTLESPGHWNNYETFRGTGGTLSYNYHQAHRF
jgi:hypothetical protein